MCDWPVDLESGNDLIQRPGPNTRGLEDAKLRCIAHTKRLAQTIEHR